MWWWISAYGEKSQLEKSMLAGASAFKKTIGRMECLASAALLYQLPSWLLSSRWFLQNSCAASCAHQVVLLRVLWIEKGLRATLSLHRWARIRKGQSWDLERCQFPCPPLTECRPFPSLFFFHWNVFWSSGCVWSKSCWYFEMCRWARNPFLFPKDYTEGDRSRK